MIGARPVRRALEPTSSASSLGRPTEHETPSKTERLGPGDVLSGICGLSCSGGCTDRVGEVLLESDVVVRAQVGCGLLWVAGFRGAWVCTKRR